MPQISDIRELVSKGQLAEAETLCLNLLDASASGEVFFLLGYIRQQTGRPTDAIAACRSAIELGFEEWSNFLSLGRSLAQTGCLAEAIDALTRARDLAPNNLDIAGALMEVTARLHGLSAARALRTTLFKPSDGAVANSIWFDLCAGVARDRVGRGDLASAEAACKEGLDADKTGDLHSLLGFIEQQTGRSGEAIISCRRAIALGHQDRDTFLVLGRSLKEDGRAEEAVAALMSAHHLAPDSRDAAVELMEAIADAQGLAAARQFFNSLGALNKDPSVRRAWSRRCAAGARSSISAGDLAQGEALCFEALEAEETGDLHALLGYVQQQTLRHAEAVASNRRAISLSHREWSSFLTLGRSLLHVGQPQDALDALESAATLAPDNLEIATLFLETSAREYGLPRTARQFESIQQRLHSEALAQSWRGILFRAGASTEAWPVGTSVRRQMTARRWAETRSYPVVAVEGIEDIPIEYPLIEGDPTAPFKTSIPSNDPYVTELMNVEIVSASHLILTDDGYALNEAGAHARYGRYVDHRSDPVVIAQKDGSLLVDVAAVEMIDLDGGVMLSGAASGAWGHWSVEYLPRLQFLAHHPDFARLPIIVDAAMPQSHFDSLAMLAGNSLIRLKPGQGARCRRLLYAPQATFFPVHVFPNPLPPYEICSASPRAYRYVKQMVEAKLGVRPAGAGKYYLSRRKTSWRRTHNENEVSAFLESEGFLAVTVEDLSFEEQVRLFQNASCIVAPMGSSLQNLIFAPTNVHLIVLSQHNLHNQAAFNGQMRALGYSPRFLCGSAVGDADEKHADFFAPIDALRAMLASEFEIG